LQFALRGTNEYALLSSLFLSCLDEMITENKYNHISSKTKLTKKAGKLPYMCFQKAGHTFIKIARMQTNVNM
jgi:hypothetical protein